MKKVILITLISTICLTVYCQSKPDEIIKTFFDSYISNTDKAIDDLYGTNSWASRVKDGIESIKKEVQSYTSDYMGKYYGYEIITKKQFSESFVLYSYMVKYDRQPMRFTFKLYKPNDKWRVYSFKN